VFDADWSALAAAGQGLAGAPLFWAIAADTTTRAGLDTAIKRASAEERGWRDRIMSAPQNRRRALLREEVRALAAVVLGTAARSVDIEEPLRDLGLDSLMAVELRNRLGAVVGRTLPATITFDYPTVSALVAYLVDEGFVDAAETRAEDVPANSASVPDKYENQTEDELAAALAARLDALQLLNERS
jgi:acyl carrier protein